MSSPKNIAILGAGRSGRAAASLARANGAEVRVFDSAPQHKLGAALAALTDLGIPVTCGSDAETFFPKPNDFDLAILSPGIDEHWPLARKFSEVNVPLTGELEYASTFNTTPLIAITGTNGKTTCTEIVASVLNGCGHRSIPCGNHGVPLSEVLLSGVSYDVLAVEVSSFQLETIRTFHPRAMIWLNFAADHLDRYPTIQAYFAAKQRIFCNATEADLAVVRHGETVSTSPARTITFSAFDPEADYFYADNSFFHDGKKIGSTDHLQLIGRHNMENVLAALIACQELGVDFSEGLEHLRHFGSSTHRCELVTEHHQRQFVNDSKATNVHATAACISSLDRPLVVVLGGFDKHLDYQPLRELLPRYARAAVLIGDIAPQLAHLLSDVLPTETAADMQDAVGRAFRLSHPGDAIVLSPGTSSFDMFANYQQRGEAFREAVFSLSSSTPTHHSKPR